MQELEGFLALADEETPPWDGVNEANMMMLAKGMALQQAGIIPLYTNLEWMVESARTASTLEGLLKGY